MANLDDLIKGDLIGVDWLDIAEDPGGNPDEATLARRHSIGYFWARYKDGETPVLVTTTTIDEDVSGSNGYCIYPEACIAGVKVIKKKRVRKERVKRDTTSNKRIGEAEERQGRDSK